MWLKKERTRSYFTTTLREATNLGQMAMTVQDTGSVPSLNDVTTLLDARLGLRGAYNNMAREAQKFVNTDTMFVERPRFYDELITLIHTTGDSVDEALSMSGEYLGTSTMSRVSSTHLRRFAHSYHCLANKTKGSLK